MTAAVIGVGGAWLAMAIGWALYQSNQMSRIKQKLEDLPDLLNGSVIRPHEGRCHNYEPLRADGTNPEILL